MLQSVRRESRTKRVVDQEDLEMDLEMEVVVEMGASRLVRHPRKEELHTTRMVT